MDGGKKQKKVFLRAELQCSNWEHRWGEGKCLHFIPFYANFSISTALKVVVVLNEVKNLLFSFPFFRDDSNRNYVSDGVYEKVFLASWTLISYENTHLCILHCNYPSLFLDITSFSSSFTSYTWYVLYEYINFAHVTSSCINLITLISYQPAS